MRIRSSPFTPSSRKTFQDFSKQGRRHRPDYALLILMSALLLCGAVVVYAIGPGLTQGTSLGTNYFSTKQLISIGLGVVAFIISASVPLRKWHALHGYVAVLAVVSAILVRFVGDEINGAHRWIQIGGFSFQSAELVKLALVLWMAHFLSVKMKREEMASPNVLKQLGIVILLIGIIVAGLQSDLGSTAVMLSIIGLMAFVAGLPLKNIGIAFVVIVALTGIAIATSSYRRDRVETFLNPTADCQSEGYQACQALITIGSGGLGGKGLGRSVQAYGYLPEPANDSIFAIVSEKFGFVGAGLMVGIFWLLFRRIAFIARSTTSEYSMLIVVGILSWLSIQMIINVGAMVGLLPLKGITLPFVSYGGTSIIFVMIAMGLVFQASQYTDLTLMKSKNEHFESHKPFGNRSRRTF